MIKSLINNFNNLDIKIHKIIKYGLKFCFLLCIISVFILVTYNSIFTTPILFYIGISLFRLSLIFGIEFIICGFIFDKIFNEIF